MRGNLLRSAVSWAYRPMTSSDQRVQIQPWLELGRRQARMIASIDQTLHGIDLVTMVWTDLSNRRCIGFLQFVGQPRLQALPPKVEWG